MSYEPLQNYKVESHDIYLGKNRRLADPVFFPAPGPMNCLTMKTIQKGLALGMGSEPPDGSRELTRCIMSQWGWGKWTRFPPGGPNPRLEDYEKSMDAMAADVLETWGKIQQLVKNNEDKISEWILASRPGIKEQEALANDSLYTSIMRSWQQTVTEFNDCHEDIKMFMEPKSLESDFHISVPDFDSPRRFPIVFLAQNFVTGYADTKSGFRDHYTAIYGHRYNFFDGRPALHWPHEGELDTGYKDPLLMFSHPDSREFYKRNRISFLVPHITSDELFCPVHLLSFIHYRGRQHPSVFAKIDNDMTFIGRRTNHLTGPFIANRMVSFDISGSGSAKGYRPKLWKGWAGRPDPEISEEEKEEYDALWHRGHLFGASEAWIMLQGQRATYHYLWNLLVSICSEIGLDPMACLTPKTLEEQGRVLSNARVQVEELKENYLNIDWLTFTRQQPFLSPPTRISPKYFGDLQFKMEIAKKHIQDLFSDPKYFFNSIYALKDHHWGNIVMKNEEENPNGCDRYSKYVEEYVDDQTRHMLYFDLIRGVLRRSIFEFYMWNSIHTRLQEFENLMRENFTDYGREGDSESDSHSDGTDMLQQPPLLLSDKKKREHAMLAEKYLSLVVLIRYHATFFVNEFRKKGIHAGAGTLFDMAYSVGLPQEETQDRLCNIQKKHYGASNLKYGSKHKDQLFAIENLSKEDNMRMYLFHVMDSFIANPLDCTNCGIQEAAAYLQEVSQTSNLKDSELVFTNLLNHTIDGLNLLSSLADHLEYLWPAMDRVGGAAVDEAVRRRYFDLGSKDISINFLDFDDFDFDRKVPMKRLQRLFLFFDELQGFKKESISMGHAKGDLKRFGASLLCKLIHPLNKQSGDRKANHEAISRLEEAMGVTGSEYIFGPKEKPLNLDKDEAGQEVFVNQPHSYRIVAAHEREIAIERQRQRDTLYGELFEPSHSDETKEEKRGKKRNRRHKKGGIRAKIFDTPASEDENKSKDEGQAMPDMGNDNILDDYIYNSRWKESLHATLGQFQLPPALETLILAQPQVTVPPLSASFQPAPKAPDGRPKGIIKKNEWKTLGAIYGIYGRENAAVSYSQLKAAMRALGYEEVGRGGSHMGYIRQEGRWPHSVLPRGENIQLAKTHGRERAAAAKGKSIDWGKRLCERGLTFEFIKQWYMKG